MTTRRLKRVKPKAPSSRRPTTPSPLASSPCSGRPRRSAMPASVTARARGGGAYEEVLGAPDRGILAPELGRRGGLYLSLAVDAGGNTRVAEPLDTGWKAELLRAHLVLFSSNLG